ncbi:hypothetical protein CSA56_05935 [candidate division KSB3 bacterium]|uniref:Uncharacterized protein n=1 Tax=candidate division KSB3 bacterium TaxID=2044937 RepID=A0A2G6KH71_9BACT|nr:MAG: hypothetical protein CSA56_05935 [candidate division KSB3 bacterium]
MMRKTSSYRFNVLLNFFLIVVGCAGPLDTATEQALVADFSGEVYLTKVYLGNHYYLPYTNNSINGRNPVGLFVDPSLDYHYQTDAGFFESGSSGDDRSLKRLQEIDRDIDFGHFAQGIQAGQLVKVTKFQDKSDQLILHVETLGRYDASKTYRGTIRFHHTRPRESRIHCLLGKEGMQSFDWATLRQILDRLLVEVPPFISESQKREFVLSNYPATPLPDLKRLTGLSTSAILALYYSELFSEALVPSHMQQELVQLFSEVPERWYQELGILLQNVEADEKALTLDCAIQEISNSLRYYTPELRAGLLFFDGIIPLTESLQTPLFLMHEPASFETLIVMFSYPYFDRNGRRFDEEVVTHVPMRALQQFLTSNISEQELANRSQIRMGDTVLEVSLSAQKAVEAMHVEDATSWKRVEVEIEKYEYEIDESGEYWIVTGDVINTGNWIARDVTVIAKGYRRFNIFAKRKASKTIAGLLKPRETKEFTIRLKKEEIDRLKLSVEWDVVE